MDEELQQTRAALPSTNAKYFVLSVWHVVLLTDRAHPIQVVEACCDAHEQQEPEVLHDVSENSYGHGNAARILQICVFRARTMALSGNRGCFGSLPDFPHF